MFYMLKLKKIIFSSQKTKNNEYNNEPSKQPINDLSIEATEELTESMQCTTTGSLESLNSVPVFILNLNKYFLYLIAYVAKFIFLVDIMIFKRFFL